MKMSIVARILKQATAQETQLTSRQIWMVVTVAVMLMSGLLACVFTIVPSNADPAGSRRLAIACGMIVVLATVWFVKLVVDALRDRRRGLSRGPASVSGWFNVFFGAAVAAGGITCSALTYWSAVAAGGGTWTLYSGMIAWGLVQMLVGWRRLT